MKMFEIVYDDGRTDGRRLDGYTISSPCEPYGSGELKRPIDIILNNLTAMGMWNISKNVSNSVLKVKNDIHSKKKRH